MDVDTKQIVNRTCFGITSNPWDRIHKYEGNVGHVVKFERLWTGPERLIRELESKVKRDFHDYQFVGTDKFRYEWITEEIPFDSLVNWVEWEVENTFTGVTDALVEAQQG